MRKPANKTTTVTTIATSQLEIVKGGAARFTDLQSLFLGNSVKSPPLLPRMVQFEASPSSRKL